MAMFAVSALSVQNVNAQDTKKGEKTEKPASQSINPKEKAQPENGISTNKDENKDKENVAPANNNGKVKYDGQQSVRPKN